MYIYIYIYIYIAKLKYSTIIIDNTINKMRRKTQNGKFTQYGRHFFGYCINTPSKQFTYLQNQFLRYYIPFLLKSSLKRTNISRKICIYFIF